MPMFRDGRPKDLHPLIDPFTPAIRFRVIRFGRLVSVDVPADTLRERYGVQDTPYGLMEAYDAHRQEIDEAVVRRAQADEAGVRVVRPRDLSAPRRAPGKDWSGRLAGGQGGRR